MAEILHEITVQAAPDKIFEAITTEHGLKSWWTVDTMADPVEGGDARMGFYNRAVTFHMKYDELSPAKRLQWNCVEGPEEWTGTTIAFDLAPAENGGTQIKFRHAGWNETGGQYPSVNTTWGLLLNSLKNYTESGAPAPMFLE